MKDTYQHPLKQKWNVPIDESGEIHSAFNGVNMCAATINWSAHVMLVLIAYAETPPLRAGVSSEWG